MLFCSCHLFRLELWCFDCHLNFILLFVILFVGKWGQRALRKEADRGEQHHHSEDRGRKSRRSSPFNIIILRRGHYQVSTPLLVFGRICEGE